MKEREFIITAKGVAIERRYRFSNPGASCMRALCAFLDGRVFHSLVVFTVVRLDGGARPEHRKVYRQK